MAYNEDDTVLPDDGPQKRRSSDLLPRYFRSTANKKFLKATLDQLIQPGVAEKVSTYIGRQTSKAFDPSNDTYLEDVSEQRANYQLEPAVTIKDNLGNVNFYKDYNDYVNQIKSFGGNVDNHSVLNSSESYSWSPNIDWDKFTNFREYYWLPNGPQSVPVRGQFQDVESTYQVATQDNLGDTTYLFTPNGFTQNPKLKLYRGQTYRFEIDTPGHPIAFAISRTFTPGAAVITAGTEGIRGNGLFGAQLYGNEYDQGEFIVLPSGGSVTFEDDENVSTLYPDGIRKLGEEGEEVAIAYLEKGTIEFTIPLNAPNKLYYISKNDVNVSGVINIYDIEENTAIDVEAEILGKKTYISENNVELTNGMKLYFQGTVTPEIYSENEWYVEGVGDEIKLVRDKDLIIPSAYTDERLVPFDANPFDRLPFGNSNSYAADKDYIIINRASNDGNAWTRYNRWFHIGVIEEAARINNQPTNLDQEARAKRPIIEFNSGLKLFNFGTASKTDVDVIDDFTKDVFSTVEGSIGYNIDGIDLAQDMRILFTADTDNLVKGKIYKVNFITIGNRRQISLLETDDSDPQELETVLVTQGNKYAGKSFYFNGDVWSLAQEKTQINQPPLFDLFDESETSLNDNVKYESSTFGGTKLFSYAIGEGKNDNELGFPLSYRNIENSGDILFDFNLSSDTFTWQNESGIFQESTSTTFLKQYKNRTVFSYVNGYSSIPFNTEQKVIRQYIVDVNQTNDFEIDVFNKAGDLNDLKINVFKNNIPQVQYLDYNIERFNSRAFIRFADNLSLNDVLIIKAKSKTKKNLNGYYEFPYNLERNPRNEDVTEFTLGEVIDHVSTIVENVPDFYDVFPGFGSLRDEGNITHYGRRFLKHSGPINLALYHLTNKKYNIVKALKYNRREYARFKRMFLQTADSLGYDGPVHTHVDKILIEMNKDKTKTMPFYFSDMLPYGPANKLEYTVLDPRNPYYALTSTFNLTELSAKSVQVYINDTLATHGKDYTFSEDGFCLIEANQQENDRITIYEYESTDGSYIPPTPTKLGLYPAYEPSIYTDDTYQNNTTVIQGHDGSISVGFNDYRDALLLEFEKRIYNNIKQKYNTDILDINEYVPGNHRTTGIETETINQSLLTDFIQWTQSIDGDYTLNDFYVRNNQFTFNYANMSGPLGETLPGFWRGVYKQAYDTDRPHTHPWEMLGLTIKPSWWNDVYGPAPYTSDNLILWTDLQEGVIKEPGKPIKRLPKYSRPGLLTHIPVDNQGNLQSPQASNFSKNFIARFTRSKFKFGDHAPIETAWRRSSEYPFALLTSLILNKPADIIGRGFDISRIRRNKANQLVYKSTGKPISISSIELPNTYADNQRKFASGFVNYIYNLISSNILSVYDDYADELSAIRNQLGFKLGGFTDKTKFKLLLDSKSPTTDTEGGVFVPDNNYSIHLNTSSPIALYNYSGVTISKSPGGFIINGYDYDTAYFNYYPHIENARDAVVSVGGISETFVEWTANKQYAKDQIIQNDNTFYRVTEKFTAEDTFSNDNLALIKELPIEGGRRAVMRRSFDKRNPQRLSYGTTLRTIQEVVDFLLGYGNYLKEIGFDFNYFNQENDIVENWDYAAKEFLFFTTQNFAEGTILSLSPSSQRLQFTSEYSVSDNIFDNFYDYSLLNVNSNPIDPKSVSISRLGNNFSIETLDENGIYNLQIPVVQKEHIVIIDNRTEFNDVIYQPTTGYRQDRIKAVGYRSDDWDGSLNIPGFIYDDVFVYNWESFKDFKIGDVIKYKEFYYTALVNVSGSAEFNSSKWVRLNEKPESDLLTNFDYRISQFSDFYDLDSDNFDAEQQRLAQHLIGYQKREYLRNIINDDVSQYKFYQGFIQDKGTTNALTKLFNALGNSEEAESLEFFEEWGIQVGQFGALDSIKEVEYILDEDKISVYPQPVELTNNVPNEVLDKVYRIKSFETYNYPDGYTHNPFPTSVIKPSNYEFTSGDEANFKREFVKTGGYVSDKDVDFRVSEKDNILNVNIEEISLGQYIWVVNDNGDWNVFQHVRSNANVTSLKVIQEGEDQLGGSPNPLIRIDLDRYPPKDIQIGTIVGIKNAINQGATGFYYVVAIERNSLILEVGVGIEIENDEEIDTTLILDRPLTRLRTVRGQDLASVNNLIEENKANRQRVWIDEYADGNYAVIENQPVYTELGYTINPDPHDQSSAEDQNYGSALAVSEDNRNLVVAASGEAGGRIHVYRRTLENNNFVLQQTIRPPEAIRKLDGVITTIGTNAVQVGDVIFQSTTGTSATVSENSTGNTITVIDITGLLDGAGTLTRTRNGVVTDLGASSQPTNNQYNERKIKFGQSVDISPDGKYIIVGSPEASELPTRFKGDFVPTSGYTKNEIIKYRESLWRVNREILPQTGAAEFSTFSSYAYLLDADNDSTEINLLVSGAPGLEDEIVDHVLIRAPIEMYLGTKIGDQISLTWNVFSILHPTLDNYLPFEGTTTLQPENLTGDHLIVQKVDLVFIVPTFTVLPEVGDLITTPTGACTVYEFIVQGDSVVIYGIDANGVFDITGNLFINDEDLIGAYDQSRAYNASDGSGGFWYINVPSYNNGNLFFDRGRGLIYNDLLKSSEIGSRQPDRYFNIQNLIQTTETSNIRDQAGQVGILTHRGSQTANPGEVQENNTDNTQQRQTYLSDLWFLRGSKTYTDELTIGREFEVYLTEFGYDAEDFGFDIDYVRGKHFVVDLWDGWIDFEYDNFDFAGFPFEPKARYKYDYNTNTYIDTGEGDIIEDIQTPFDGFGGLALTSNTTSSAEVMFYQRNFNNIRVFVKIISGSWTRLNNIGRYELRRTANNSIRPQDSGNDVNRIMGEVIDTDNDLALGTDKVGKLIIVRDPNGAIQLGNANLEGPQPYIQDKEYWFFFSRTTGGIAREANPPFALNKDYTQVYNIPVDKFGTKQYTKEGCYSVFRRLGTNEYEHMNSFVSLNRGNNRFFGNGVKIVQDGNDYSLIISSRGAATKNNSGTVEMFKHGFDSVESGEFKGTWLAANNYNRGDIVTFEGKFLEARRDVVQNVVEPILISNSTAWKDLSWRTAKDENYRGEFETSEIYIKGEMVTFDGNLYVAKTNIAAGSEFDINSFGLVDSAIDYLGYLPNDGGFTLFDDESTFDPQQDINQFAKTFDFSSDANLLVIASEQQLIADQWTADNNIDDNLSDSSTQIALLIYKLRGGKYFLDQKIFAPNNNTAWAHSISISNDGKSIAVGEPFNDDDNTDEGTVFVYTENSNGQFEQTQRLNSPSDQESELFGYSVYFDNEQLAVGSLNGDIVLPTTFDNFTGKLTPQPIVETDIRSEYVNDPLSIQHSNTTIFDDGFTTFRNTIKDSGVVYMYEKVEDKLIFGEKFRTQDTSLFRFGENIIVNNNHTYIGLTTEETDTFKGKVLDFRKPIGSRSWNVISSLIQPVDVDKIESVFLYNKRTNTFITYLDVVDPIQGKIAGPAEQELKYKTPYDPALYNVGNVADLFDEMNPWGKDYVGQLWWDVSTARFRYPYQGETQEQTNAWNTLLPGFSIDVYEWVESTKIPSEWDDLVGTTTGTQLGISGETLYSDALYTQIIDYDPVSQTFGSKYYFWVKNTTIIPRNTTVERRSSTVNVANLIADPGGQGYRHINFLGKTKFALHNIQNFLINQDVVLGIRYIDGKIPEQNIHTQYQILTDGLETSSISRDIERKWFDSLIGYDEQDNLVPDPKLPAKQKYGNRNLPRQSMFINKTEALKQVIERTNSVLQQYTITDEYDISPLDRRQSVPSVYSRLYDTAIDTTSEFRFIGTSNIKTAQLEPVILNGKITRVNIVDPGFGYKDLSFNEETDSERKGPIITLSGNGSGAELETIIDDKGRITNVRVLSQGSNYDDQTSIKVRKFTVLVKTDEQVYGKWALYTYNIESKTWFRDRIQKFDVTLFWEYIDWYKEGYNAFTSINFVVPGAYALPSIDDSVGDIVKIDNIGTSGWLLLRKKGTVDTDDYTVNYETIGRQNGTIKFKDNLYDLGTSAVGFGSRTFDSYFYDSQPIIEIRYILETIRDNIFIEELRNEYNQLFLSSLRYALSEQPYLDWAFKTSYVKVKHKLGKLRNDITFNNDNLESYEAYIDEVKPYSTNIREYVSQYNGDDNTKTSTTDFDTPATYNPKTKRIEPTKAKVLENSIIAFEPNQELYPRKFWKDNIGYEVTDIQISNPGSGYTYKPTVKIIGGGGEGATAEAFLGNGKITSIKVTNVGSGYINRPTVTIEGSQTDGGEQATASVIVGNGLTRTAKVQIKFDRLSGTFFILDLEESETFTGSGNITDYRLKYPMDLRTTEVTVTIDGIELLRSEYTFENFIDTSKSYTRNKGIIKFTNPPALDTEVVVNYRKNISMLSAQDRVNLEYKPTVGMPGKELAQVMDGIDYGGVEVRSYGFLGPSGWGSEGWYSTTWDTFDTSFVDERFVFDGSTISVQLTQPLEDGTEYHFYLKRANETRSIRIDDPNFGTSDAVTNTNAIMQSVTGDGQTNIIFLDELGITVADGDELIIRNFTSDGSIQPNQATYDTSLSGGDLAHTTAKGTRAEDIIIDGDGFVTPTTSKGPEELVPGQVVDTLDLKVYTRPGPGQGQIFTQSYITDGETVEFDLGVIPSNNNGVLVKLDNVILSSDQYDIDYRNNKIIFNSPTLDAGQEFNILTVSNGQQQILDNGTFIADGESSDYLTTVEHLETISAYVTVDGVPTDVFLLEAGDSYELQGRTILRFEEAPESGAVIRYALFYDDEVVNYSQISKDVFTADGSSNVFTLAEAPLYRPFAPYNIIVKVDNKILNAGYNRQFDVTSLREYQLETFQAQPTTIPADNIKVFINGDEKIVTQEWRFDIFNSSVVLFEDVGQPGDVLEVFVLEDGEYSLDNTTLTLTDTPVDNAKVEVFRFTNHDIVGIERINYDIVQRSVLTAGTEEYSTYHRLKAGEITLREPAIDSQYVWLAINGELLTPNVDYYVAEDKTKVRISQKVQNNDVIDVIHFTASAAHKRFGFKQFKDMLNRVHYKRIDTAETTLAKDLNYYDLRIEVMDGSKLPEPNKSDNIPGIIFIKGERIEYLVKQDNTLRQITRGTLGTGTKDLYNAGTDIFDTGPSKNIPYSDKIIEQEELGDDTTNTWPLNFKAFNVNEFEVFVAGRRLRKTEFVKFDPTLDLDSPEGDVTLPAEFTLNNEVDENNKIVQSNIQFTETPGSNVRILIIKRTLELWSPPGIALADADNEISAFMQQGTIDLPE